MKIVALGEIMMRLSNEVGTEINRAQRLDIYFGGSEYNTLVNLAGLGHDVKMVTSLPDNMIVKKLLDEAHSYGVGTENINILDGRLGTYYAILGDDLTPTEVIYDREGSSFSKSTINNYNFESIFKGVDLFHISGITPAINKNTKELTIEAIKYAKSQGIKISYDSNFRAKLWSKEEAGEFLRIILPMIDYAFMGILDIKNLLDIEVDNVEEGYEILKRKYNNIKYFASTERKIINNSLHELRVNIYDGELYKTEFKKMNVKERIGGGDVFTAGVIDGIITGQSKVQIAEFALVDAMIKHQRYGDNSFITRREVNNVFSKNTQEIKR